jgi:hypothetical protein
MHILDFCAAAFRHLTRHSIAIFGKWLYQAVSQSTIGDALKWLLIFLSLSLAGCQTSGTTASSVESASPHPDLPANYRRQIAEYMRTQLFAAGGIRNAEIS